MARPRTGTEPDSDRLQGEVRIADPAALRALAHPARLTIVDELYQGFERTATELAELTGLSASAMSYHLRALERWGVVVRGAARGDARERPWRAAARSLSVSSESVSAAAIDVIAGTTVEHLRDEFRRWALVEKHKSKVWQNVGRMSRSYLWLTEAEAKGFASDLAAVLEKYKGDRDAVHHPPGTRRVLCVVATVPEARVPNAENEEEAPAGVEPA